jgi:hypothetical protein
MSSEKQIGEAAYEQLQALGTSRSVSAVVIVIGHFLIETGLGAKPLPPPPVELTDAERKAAQAIYDMLPLNLAQSLRVMKGLITRAVESGLVVDEPVDGPIT